MADKMTPEEIEKRYIHRILELEEELRIGKMLTATLTDKCRELEAQLADKAHREREEATLLLMNTEFQTEDDIDQSDVGTFYLTKKAVATILSDIFPLSPIPLDRPDREALKGKIIDALHWKQYWFMGQGEAIYEGSLTQESEEQIAELLIPLIDPEVIRREVVEEITKERPSRDKHLVGEYTAGWNDYYDRLTKLLKSRLGGKKVGK